MTRLLTEATALLNVEREQSGLDYLSKIDGEDGAWYFWLKDVEGVYELKEFSSEEDNGVETTVYGIRYYPGLEENLFERFSFNEQVLRLGELFEQGEIDMSGEFDACPCCGGGQHEHTDSCLHSHIKPRAVGIPNILKRRELPQSMYLVGSVEFKLEGDQLKELVLSTQNELTQIADKGIVAQDAEGHEVVVIPSKGYDRQVPGLQLCDIFHQFLLKKMLCIMGITPAAEFVHESTGMIIHDTGEGGWYEEASDEVKTVRLRNVF